MIKVYDIDVTLLKSLDQFYDEQYMQIKYEFEIERENTNKNVNYNMNTNNINNLDDQDDYL